MNCNHHGGAEQPRDEPADRAEREHQEGELERVHLDDDEDQDEGEPEHPGPAADHIGIHGGILSRRRLLETSTGNGCRPGSPRSLGWGIVNDVLPPESLRGLRVLITGSSRGIGADTAGYLAAAGAKVVINFRNKEARALKVVAGIEAAGGEALAIGADLTDPASVAAMFAEVRDAWGGLDILVLECLRRHGVAASARTTR